MSSDTVNIFTSLSTSPTALSGNFENTIFKFLTQNEGCLINPAKGTFYVNIGYGYNMVFQRNHLESDLSYIAKLKLPGTVLTLADVSGDIKLLADVFFKKKTNTTVATDIKNHYTVTAGLDGSAWQLSILALNRILSHSDIGLAENPGSTVQYDSKSFIVPPSYQLVALEDMAYNGGAHLVAPQTHLIGDLKEAALTANAGDWMNAWSSRASAWYEIAINSDKYHPPKAKSKPPAYLAAYENYESLELRRLRDAQEFGLYSQAPGWDPGSVHAGTIQPSTNIPNSSDHGEEAISSLRFLQDNSAAITGIFGSIAADFNSLPQAQQHEAKAKGYDSLPSSSISILASWESPAVKLLNQLYAAPYGLSFDASHVIDTQAVNGLVEAPGTGSYMLIGAQFATTADPSVTGGFTYGAPLSDKLVSGPNGGDVLLGFAGNNTLMINGSDNIAFNDVVTIPGVETYHNFDTIIGNSNTLFATLGDAYIKINGNDNTIYAGANKANLQFGPSQGSNNVTISSTSTDNLVILGLSPTFLVYEPNLNLLAQDPQNPPDEPIYQRMPGASIFQSDGMAAINAVVTVVDWACSSADLTTRPIITEVSPGYRLYDGVDFYFPGSNNVDINGYSFTQTVMLEPDGQQIVINNLTVFPPTGSGVVALDKFRPDIHYAYPGAVQAATSVTAGDLIIAQGSTQGSSVTISQSVFNTNSLVEITDFGTAHIDANENFGGVLFLASNNSYAVTNLATGQLSGITGGDGQLTLDHATLTFTGSAFMTDFSPDPLAMNEIALYVDGTGAIEIAPSAYVVMQDVAFADPIAAGSVAPTLLVDGTAVQTGYLQLGSGPETSGLTISNTGLYILDNGDIYGSGTVDAAGSFVGTDQILNQGLMDVGGPAVGTTPLAGNQIHVNLENAGSIDLAQQGYAALFGDLVNSGLITIEQGATLLVDGPVFNNVISATGGTISVGSNGVLDVAGVEPSISAVAVAFTGAGAAVNFGGASAFNPDVRLMAGSTDSYPLLATLQSSGMIASFTLASAGLSATVNGGVNQISLASGANLLVNGGRNTITVTGANSAVTLNQTAGAATVVASGANETINGNSLGDVIDATSLQLGSSVILTSTSAVVTLGNAGIALVGALGSADTILGAGGTVADFGTNDVMSVTGGVVYTYDTNGSVTAAGAAVMHIGGSGEAVSLADGASSVQDGAAGGSVVAVSRGNLIAVSGPGTYVDLKQAGGAETVLASGANETIRGNDVGDVIEAANLQAGSDVILTSTNAMVTLGNAGIALVGSTGSADTILSAGGTVIDVGTHDVMSVTGGVVYAYGANASVTAAGDSVIVADSAMITTTGGNNLISMGGPDSSVLVASAGQDTVQVAGGLTVQGGAASLVVRNVGSGAVSISQGSGAVTANGGAGAVTLFGGTAGDNVLIGGTGAANMLEAAVGNATLQAAGSGATTLIGGAGAVDFIAAGGAETMLGGTGAGAANRFIFGTNAASVNASIFGFASSTSQIMLEDGVAVTGQSVAARGDLVTLSNGGSILLMGVNAALSAGAVNNGVTVLR